MQLKTLLDQLQNLDITYRPHPRVICNTTRNIGQKIAKNAIKNCAYAISQF